MSFNRNAKYIVSKSIKSATRGWNSIILMLCSVLVFLIVLIKYKSHPTVVPQEEFIISTALPPLSAPLQWIRPSITTKIHSKRTTTTRSPEDQIFKKHKQFLKRDLKDFPFPNQTTLSNYTLATNGQPLRSVVITSWRSGSTFFGDILEALPGTYYHYEPLNSFGVVQVRNEPMATEAVDVLKKLLNCDYSTLDKYMEHYMKSSWMFTHNKRSWKLCKKKKDICFTKEAMTRHCKLYPWQVMKVIRLRMALASQLLEDESLNVRIVLLVRDPRGTLQSRKSRPWCTKPDCNDPSLLCSDLVSDYHAAKNLMRGFPARVKIVRYEDFSVNPEQGTKDIFSFYGLPFEKTVENFLDLHTKNLQGGPHSTFRDSKTVPFHWIGEMSFSEIQHIQDSCGEALDLWGYKMIRNASEINPEFNPMLPLE